ncbi:MAG: DUF2634 domain-containing protein [Vallitalea sp.]|jgi:hypothetical protein|nr:DUF2634 domain-containing protein [Vallitalea sp.]
MNSESLFPFFPEEIKAFNESIGKENNKVTAEGIYKDIQWDYENNKPLLINGNFVIVEGLEAIKVWCWKVLHTERYKYLIYTWDYAIDIEQFIGKSLSNFNKVEIIKEITEGLMQNMHVTSVDNFIITTEKKEIFIEFNINTEYGVLKERKKVIFNV